MREWTEHGDVWRKEELHRKLDEDDGKKMIFKMARGRTDDGRDVKRGRPPTVIEDNNGRLITESKEVLSIWARYFTAAERKRSSKLPRAPELDCERCGSGRAMTGRSGNSNAQDEKGKATGADEVRLEVMEMAGEVGVKWTGRQLSLFRQEGRIPKAWRMGLIVPIWKSKGGMHEPGKCKGITLLSQVLKLLERVLDARIRRRVGDFGGNSKGSGRGEEQQVYVLEQMERRDWRYRAVWLGGLSTWKEL